MKTSPNITIFLKSHKREVRFVLYFILFFPLLQIAHYSLKRYTSPMLVHKLNTEVNSEIINFITPDEKTFTRGYIIGSGDFAIKVARGRGEFDPLRLKENKKA